jgi:ribosome modulation factor
MLKKWLKDRWQNIVVTVVAMAIAFLIFFIMEVEQKLNEKQGYESAKNGFGAEVCPFIDSAQRGYWMDGWQRGKLEMKSKE